MRHSSITDTERQAIDKKELTEYSQKQLRGTGYQLMHDRDRGWGATTTLDGKEVIIEWNIEGGSRVHKDYEAHTVIPDGHFVIKVGKETAIINKEAFHKLFRWV